MTGRTPEELHAAGWKWWQVEVAVGAPAASQIRGMRRGVLSAALRSRVEEWLAEQAQRRQDPPRQE